MAGWLSIGTLSLHAAQYAPCNRVSRKPKRLRRSLITVSEIVRPPHRLHSIATPASPLSVSGAHIKLWHEQIKNNQRENVPAAAGPPV